MTSWLFNNHSYFRSFSLVTVPKNLCLFCLQLKWFIRFRYYSFILIYTPLFVLTIMREMPQHQFWVGIKWNLSPHLLADKLLMLPYINLLLMFFLDINYRTLLLVTRPSKTHLPEAGSELLLSSHISLNTDSNIFC